MGVQSLAEWGEIQFHFSLLRPPADVTDFEGSQGEGSLSARRQRAGKLKARHPVATLA